MDSFYCVRFEAELAGTLRPTAPSLMRPSTVRSQAPGFQNKPASTFFVPPQLQRAGVRPVIPAQGSAGTGFTAAASAPATVAAAAVISNKPVLYKPDSDAKPEAVKVAKTAAPTTTAGPAAKKTKVEATPTKQGSSSVSYSRPFA